MERTYVLTLNEDDAVDLYQAVAHALQRYESGILWAIKKNLEEFLDGGEKP